MHEPKLALGLLLNVSVWCSESVSKTVLRDRSTAHTICDAPCRRLIMNHLIHVIILQWEEEAFTLATLELSRNERPAGWRIVTVRRIGNIIESASETL